MVLYIEKLIIKGGVQMDFSAAMESILKVTTEVFTFMTTNPLLMLFIGASLIPVGISIFTSMKQATH